MLHVEFVVHPVGHGDFLDFRLEQIVECLPVSC
jgi:hypothetical protein